MESHPLYRHFEFHGVKLPDPDPKLSVEEIRTLYAHQFPDIATAAITGPEAGRRQAGLSVHASHRHKGITHEPKYSKERR